ncbi:MAG: DUF3800 domain-containing protein [Bacteroidota bacterium]
MSIYFGFSDECGKYQNSKSKKYLRVHPYYLRSTLLIDAEEWKKLNNQFCELKVLFDFPLEKEIKWAYLWQLRNYQKRNETVPDKRDFKFLESYDYHDLIEFVEKALQLLESLNYKKIILTYTENASSPNINEKAMLKMHLQEHMQRIEMQIQTRSEENLAVLFFDPVSEETDQHLRDIYFDLYNSGDFIHSYKHIKDSLNIEHSHQSVGIQISDYISGTFSAILKGRSSEKYDRGKKMFYNHVYPNLRKHNGRIWGIGVREVPSSSKRRKELAKHIDEEKDKFAD